ncbi:hypothetical protein EJB05_47330, partial [Eragrostis curvula]
SLWPSIKSALWVNPHLFETRPVKSTKMKTMQQCMKLVLHLLENRLRNPTCVDLSLIARIQKKRGQVEEELATKRKIAAEKKHQYRARKKAELENSLPTPVRPTTLTAGTNSTLGFGSNTTTPFVLSYSSLLNYCSEHIDIEAQAMRDTITNPALGSGSIVNPFSQNDQKRVTINQGDYAAVDDGDDSWLHRNEDWCPAPSGGVRQDENIECVTADSVELNETQRSRWRASSQRYRKRKKENIDTIKSDTEDQSTPEECKRSLWRNNSQCYGKHQKGTLANEVQCDSAGGMKRKANVAQLDKNVEFQNQYRRRKSTQITSQAAPSGTINPTLCTGEQSRANDGTYDSGIWVPDASERPGLDEENLETHKPIDDDIDDPFADDEGRVFVRLDVQYKSYRVNRQDGGAEGRTDPHDYVYHNLPKKHHVLGHAPDTAAPR